jgi:hypothetical protein
MSLSEDQTLRIFFKKLTKLKNLMLQVGFVLAIPGLYWLEQGIQASQYSRPIHVARMI